MVYGISGITILWYRFSEISGKVRGIDFSTYGIYRTAKWINPLNVLTRYSKHCNYERNTREKGSKAKPQTPEQSTSKT